MATRVALKTTFEPGQVIQPVFTGGSVGIDKTSRILATSLGEDAVLTDLTTGRRLALVEGDGEVISTLTSELPCSTGQYRMWLTSQS